MYLTLPRSFPPSQLTMKSKRGMRLKTMSMGSALPLVTSSGEVSSSGGCSAPRLRRRRASARCGRFRKFRSLCKISLIPKLCFSYFECRSSLPKDVRSVDRAAHASKFSLTFLYFWFCAATIGPSSSHKSSLLPSHVPMPGPSLSFARSYADILSSIELVDEKTWQYFQQDSGEGGRPMKAKESGVVS